MSIKNFKRGELVRFRWDFDFSGGILRRGIILRVEEDYYSHSSGITQDRVDIFWNSGGQTQEPENGVERINNEE